MEELCSTQLLALLHSVGLGLGLGHTWSCCTHTASRWSAKNTPQSSGLAPNLSHWEVQPHGSRRKIWEGIHFSLE